MLRIYPHFKGEEGEKVNDLLKKGGIMSDELNSWGVVLTEAIPYSAGIDCRNCGWQFWLIDYPAAFEYVVGFDSHLGALDYFDTPANKVKGRMIMECPKCFEKFWIHVHELTVQEMKRHGLWPGEPNYRGS